MPEPEFPPTTLPPDVIDHLRSSQRLLAESQHEMDRAERCGLNCKSMRKEARAHADKIERLLAEYPQRPPGME